MRLRVITFALVAGSLVHLHLRSRVLDESLEISRTEVSQSLVTIDRSFKVGWGPHGFRLWFWFDSQPIDEMFRDLTSPRGPDWDIDWKSEPYVEGSSWGWLIASRWNRLGFWWERQHYEWESGHRRRLLLIAAPFWFAGILLISGITAYELAKRKLSLTKRWSQLR